MYKLAALTFIVSFGIAVLIRAVDQPSAIGDPAPAGPRTRIALENLDQFHEIAPYRIRMPRIDAAEQLLNFEYSIEESRIGTITSLDYWVTVDDAVVHVHQTDAPRRVDQRRDWTAVRIDGTKWQRTTLSQGHTNLATTFRDGVSVYADGPQPQLRIVVRQLN